MATETRRKSSAPRDLEDELNEDALERVSGGTLARPQTTATELTANSKVEVRGWDASKKG